MVWYGVVWYGMGRYSMLWYGMVRYGMVWYGMRWCVLYNVVGQYGELRYDVYFGTGCRATVHSMVRYGKCRSIVLVGVRISCCLDNDELRVVKYYFPRRSHRHSAT